MSHYVFVVLLLVLGSGTLYSVDISGTPNPTSAPTPQVTTGNTVPTAAPTPHSITNPAPVPTDATTAAATTTAPTNATTAAALTTAPTNATTAPAPTTAPANATTAAAPTTAPANATTAAAPTTAPANATTAAAPTTAPANATTAAAPTTAPANATTAAAPTTAPANATTAAPPVPTTAAPSPMPPPSVGNYSVRIDGNGTACLLATMGLQISYKDGEIFKNLNLVPNATKSSGKCGVNGSDASLVLTFEKSSITFTFREDGPKFRLHAVNVSLVLGTTGSFSAANANLSLWEASLGSSYMCRRDQTYNITDLLILHTKDLQVQPYTVQNDSYATAHDCAMDDTSILIPIVVGAALAGLILIVMIAYAIGRRKTYVGYQTL